MLDENKKDDPNKIKLVFDVMPQPQSAALQPQAPTGRPPQNSVPTPPAPRPPLPPLPAAPPAGGQQFIQQLAQAPSSPAPRSFFRLKLAAIRLPHISFKHAAIIIAVAALGFGGYVGYEKFK